MSGKKKSPKQPHDFGTHEIETKCPWCGAEVVFASNATPGENVGPIPGNPMLCIYCGEWSIFARRNRLRKPSDAEFEEIAATVECQIARMAWLKTQDEIKRGIISPPDDQRGRGDAGDSS